jgi:nitrite reductase/ring-hydroxylating ferredoxin subunit/uncharacterized membrane protein
MILMLSRTIEQTVDRITILQKDGEKLSETIHQLVLQGGEPARKFLDLLHGTWLGHPLHPLLTDLVIGAWSLAAFFDILSLNEDSTAAEQAADTLTIVGTAAVIPTSLSGLADFSAISKSASGMGVLHALVVDVGLLLNLISIYHRRKGSRGTGIFFSLLGLGAVAAGGYLGGHLVFNKKVGVKHGPSLTEPAAWTAVLAADDLPENSHKPVEVAGQSVLLYRTQGQIYAVSATCPHAGAPLAEGKFDGPCVTCPWHDSVFDLRGGQVVHGPATYPLPQYETRLQIGQIEVRAVSG